MGAVQLYCLTSFAFLLPNQLYKYLLQSEIKMEIVQLLELVLFSQADQPEGN